MQRMDIAPGTEIERIITVDAVYYQKDSFSIVSAHDSEEIKETYKGPIIAPVKGDKFKVWGTYVDDVKYGRQISVSRAEIYVSDDAKGILRYLSSGRITGCGKVTAKKIVEHFGDDSLKIIRDDYMKLAEVPGISDKKALNIHNSEANSRSIESLLSLPGITYNKAEKLYAKYKDKAVEMIKDHPYDVIYDIDGFGFKTVDAIALANGMDKNSDERAKGAMNFVLQTITENGDCYCNRDELYAKIRELTVTKSDEELDVVLKSEIDKTHIVNEDGMIYSSYMYGAETACAKCLEKLSLNETKLSDAVIESAITGNTLEDAQKQAVKTVLKCGVSVVTGGAGTGKTTVIRSVIEANNKLRPGEKIVLCAPTGKASRRMAEVTNHSAYTVHKLVYAYEQHRMEKPRNALFICDEASMLDISIASKLLLMIDGGNNRIVFVGDVSQLPPVGPGTFFRDILNNSNIDSVTLTFCHRQTGNIAFNANQIRIGGSTKTLRYDGLSTKFFSAYNADPVPIILRQYSEMIDKYGKENVCVLAPMKKMGRTAVNELNIKIREIANNVKPEPGCRFAVGDRVINLKNDYDADIFNGDVGTVTACNPEDGEFNITMDSGVHVFYPIAKQEQFDFAYAMTIHKSQGSEYKAVILAITTQHFIMLERNLLYTAVTRAKDEMIIVGETRAIAMAIKQVKAVKRKTFLSERINKLMSPV